MTMMKFAQRGSLLIAAVVLIAVIAALASVLSFLQVGSTTSSAEHLSSAKALFVAESGLEYAAYQLKSGTACASLSSTQSVGEGSFTVAPGVPYTASIALAANITAVDTVIPVSATTGFADHGRIRIENEDIDYAARSTSCAPFASPACFTGAKRGVAGSTAAAHTTGAGVNVAQDQCQFRSTGTVSAGNAQRVVERSVRNPGAMMVYAKGTGDTVPYFRLWDGSNWGPERSATSVSAGIQYMVLKFARTRNEAILGTLDATGDIRMQVWNGVSWGATTLLANIGTPNYRGFDIEYETSGDRAVVVYNNADSADPAYRIWNGSAWSAAVSITDPPTTGAPYWIELAPNPLSTSNEIAMILLANVDDVYGMVWTGSAWSTMGDAAAWDLTATPATKKGIDVAYEQVTRRAMFIWADSLEDISNYRIWNGATLTALATVPMPTANQDGPGEWVRLVSQPASNTLMYGVQDNGNRDGSPNLSTAFWSGTAWTVFTRHDDRVEDLRDRNFDIVFETHPANTGKAWLMWGDDVRVSRKQWSGTSWGGATSPPPLDDTALVQLRAHPVSGAIFAGIYQDLTSSAKEIQEMHFTNGSTTPSTLATIWGGPVVDNPVMERIDIAAEKYFPVVDWREVYP